MATIGAGVRNSTEVTNRIREILDDATQGTTPAQAVAATHSALSDYVVARDAGEYTDGTVAAAVPGAFVANQWDVVDEGSGSTVTISIKQLPKTNGEAITGIEYTTNAGSNWKTIGAGAPALGDYDIDELSSAATNLTDDAEYTIALRCVNSEGNAAASDNKTVTPTAPA